MVEDERRGMKEDAEGSRRDPYRRYPSPRSWTRTDTSTTMPVAKNFHGFSYRILSSSVILHLDQLCFTFLASYRSEVPQRKNSREQYPMGTNYVRSKIYHPINLLAADLAVGSAANPAVTQA